MYGIWQKTDWSTARRDVILNWVVDVGGLNQTMAKVLDVSGCVCLLFHPQMVTLHPSGR